MKSMTGFGRGTAADAAGNRLNIEISTVNSRKQVDVRLTLPRELAAMENEARQLVVQRLSRGNVHVVVTYQLSEAVSSVHINIGAAVAAAEQLRLLSQKANLAAPALSDVVGLPGVIDESGNQCREILRPLLATAMDEALKALQKARSEEGARLKEDLLARGSAMQELLHRIVSREDEALAQFKERLRQRIAMLGVEVASDDERLAREMVFYADKSDISEEVVRLQSHLVKYRQLLDSEDDPGRELDFLGQEMNREITTLSSKTADLCISADAMALKVEISKVREQFMNIE